jgi:hypothetical protein
MKKISFYYFVAAFTCISVSLSCNKSSMHIAAMQAKVDGVLVVCDTKVELSKALSGTLYGISGVAKDGSSLMLLFPIASGVGTYQFLGFNASYQNEGWFSYNGDNQYKSINGSVVVTESTGNKFKGTFSFDAQKYLGGTKSITEGVFEIAY